MSDDVTIKFPELEAFLDRIRSAANGGFKRDIERYLEAIGTEFLRIVVDEIIRRGVVDTRLLVNSFHQNREGNVWEMSDDGLTLEVGTNVEYAAYVNDGHWTVEKGKLQRFVPGYWRNQEFVYDPGATSGMLLRQKWVEGSHYWQSAVRIMEKLMPDLLNSMLDNWLRRYFADFID